MTDQQLQPAAPADHELGGIAREISELARELATETERRRRLADELLLRLRASGVMLAGAPREAGGLELPPGIALRCAEEIARGDASAGWCVSIAATSSLLAAYLPVDGRAGLFDDPRGIAAGVWAPRGRAHVVDGGVLVSGRWAYCSGIDHAGVFFAGCFIEDGENPPGERSLPSVVGMPKADLEILDTWHTLGLRGTGSHDVVAEQLFVPSSHMLSLFDGPLIDRPLYRFPIFGYFALSIAAAALGNAQGMMEEFVELAQQKVGQGSTRTLAQRSPTQAAVAEAEATLRAARSLYYESIEAAWEAVAGEDPVPVALRNGIRLAATHAARASAEVVRSLYDLAGGPAIYDDSPLQRRFRDAHTATAHFQVNAASLELPGRLLLSQPAETMML
ncbi:MAG TPA: acyl-CoA dehydrogenase family protein [Solirubrobacteraceae bacterium]|jgi:alkylation response protein AidB-like acyl-CoA dehydrogenase|nr:acyl-CoA dehydrogenase family protein [Solirubrobacteraceae bacterium]